jgi:hypothetical protein
MFYSYKNCRVLINSQSLLTNETQVSLEANSAPVWLVGNRNSFGYSATNGLIGTMRLNYFLTGADYLKNFITDETIAITGYFGGLYFNSGYLKNYSWTASPNSPVNVSAEIVFFEDLKGSFSPSTEQMPSDTILNFCHTTVAGTNIGNLNLLSMSYNFVAEITPAYRVTTGNNEVIYPTEVKFGPKQISAELQTNHVTGYVPMSGRYGRVTATLGKPTGELSSPVESYTVAGKIDRVNLSVSPGKKLTSVLSITQNNLLEEPLVYGFSPLSGAAGSYVTISGINFSGPTDVWFHDKKSLTVSLLGSTGVYAKIPTKSINGKISVATFGGIGLSTGTFLIIQSPIVPR